ncbi:O-antigen translocase [Legionella longbeachae]|uniref:O-antigen translocase n=1 Tax=Legionella longbeachae TaxID=450 RepID=UPI001246C325|nr:O-antigen translocase [Legionella longbeachae]QEY50098.1 O-antigen translocase [Legionella longbeachae]QEY50228.1 O-antigen translocase [Legionella longbeachae]
MKISSKLLQTSFFSGISTLVKILTGMVSLKIIALYAGPEGVAILGQFMSLANIFATIAGGGIALGVIKYVAEYAQTGELQSFLPTATLYTLLFSFVTTLLGFIYSQKLAEWILGSTQYAYLMRWTAFVQLFIALHLLLCAILNGFKQIRLLVSITIISSLLSLIMMSCAAVFYPLKSILCAFVIAQSLAVVISLLFVFRKDWFRLLFSLNIKKQYLINLLRYSFMSSVSTLTVPLAQIVVRNDLSALFGWESVGYWQAVVRLSDAYLLFVTAALTTYYLPRLSELQTPQALKQEIRDTHRIFMPLIGFILIVIYLFRGFIINLLYSKTFNPATELFSYQLLGDFFRIASWLFTYLLLAKAWTKTYVFTEVILSIIFVSLSHLLARTYGLPGVTYAFALTYFVYWLLMGMIVLFYFKQENKNYKLAATS